MKACKDNLTLSLPILLTRLLGIISNLIAMALIAKLGTEALSASALIMGIFSICILLVLAFGFSICALVAEANSRQDNKEVGKIITNALMLNSLLALPFLLIFYFITPILIFLHQPIQIAKLTGMYFHGMLLGYLPMIWAGVIEQFLLGIGKPRYILFLSLESLLLMPLFSEIFIFGKWNVPAFGMLGAGYAMSASAIVTSLTLLFFLIVKGLHKKYYLFLRGDFNLSLQGKLFHLGWPMALQFAGEFFAYISITLMMGWVGVIALAAQQIILQFNTVVIMLPTSVSQATSILIAKAKGMGDAALINLHLKTGMLVVSAFMAVIASAYIFFPHQLIQIYINNTDPQYIAIVSLTSTFLLNMTFSQFFDGIKNVISGAYRGLQQTKFPMILSTATLWLISLPAAYCGGFILPFGAIGIRWGFTCGVVVGAALLAIAWFRNESSAERTLVPIAALNASEG